MTATHPLLIVAAWRHLVHVVHVARAAAVHRLLVLRRSPISVRLIRLHTPSLVVWHSHAAWNRVTVDIVLRLRRRRGHSTAIVAAVVAVLRSSACGALAIVLRLLLAELIRGLVLVSVLAGLALLRSVA